MKTIRRTKIVTRIRELVSIRQNAENETARAVCPFCRNLLAGSALSSARQAAVSETNKNAAELPPVKDECLETEK